MASATDFIDLTSTDAFRPEIWSPLTQVATEANLVMANRVDRRFEQGLSYGDTIHVPPVSNMGAARTKAENTAITYETTSETNIDISITTHTYQAQAVESIAKIQANRDMLKLYTGKMGYALALAVDDHLAGLVDDFTQTVGTLAVENEDDDYIRARQYLNDANAPMGDRTILISPGAEAGLLKLDRFVHADYSAVAGGTASAAQEAYIGTWYRVPLYVSTNTEGANSTGHDNAMFHRESIALVMQLKPTFHAQYDIDYFCDKLAVEQIYGYREMRDVYGVWIKGA